MSNLQHQFIFTFIRKHWKSTLFTSGIGIVANLMTILIPTVITFAYVILFDIQGSKARFVTNRLEFHPTFSTLIIIFFLAIILKGIIEFMFKYNMGKLGERLIFELRGQLFQHQLKVNMEEYDKRGMGRFLLRYSGDLSSIHGYLTKGLIRFVADTVMLVITFSILWIIYPLLAAVLLGWFILMNLIINHLNKIHYKITEKRRNRKSNLLSFVNQRLMSILSLQTFNKERPEQNKFDKKTTELNKLGIEFQRMASFIHALIPLMMYSMIGIVLIFVFFEKNNPKTTLNSDIMLLIVLMLISLLPFFRRLLSVNMVWKKGKISIRKLNNILNLNTNPFDNLPDLICEKGSLQVDQLLFEYNNRKPIFKNLTFTLSPNMIHHIQGTSRSGKTTLIKLLTAVYYPSFGSVAIDHHSSTSVNPKSWRKQIAVVADEWQLYGKTVFEAISYGKSKKYKKRAISILKQLQNGQSISLELNDSIGDFGNNLSQTERKILMYARALMTRKPILLIDNPFEGMDFQLRNSFIKLLKKLKQKHTIILIANDLYELEADNIITLSNADKKVFAPIK